MSTAGYSGKSQTDKLGIKAGDLVLAINPPLHYRELLESLPDSAGIGAEAQPPAPVHAPRRSHLSLMMACL